MDAVILRALLISGSWVTPGRVRDEEDEEEEEWRRGRLGFWEGLRSV